MSFVWICWIESVFLQSMKLEKIHIKILNAILIILGIASIFIVISVLNTSYIYAENFVSASSKLLCSDTNEIFIFNSDSSLFSKFDLIVDTASINVKFLEDMQKNGQLLTSDEFASRIASYYDTLVATLTGIFVLFTIISYFSIRSGFELELEEKIKLIEDKNRDFINKTERELDNKIIEVLKKLLTDSITAKRVISDNINESLGGYVDDFVTPRVEAIEEQNDDLLKKCQDIMKLVKDNQYDIESLQHDIEELKKNSIKFADINMNYGG